VVAQPATRVDAPAKPTVLLRPPLVAWVQRRRRGDHLRAFGRTASPLHAHAVRNAQ
jgi:hypothetical protein